MYFIQSLYSSLVYIPEVINKTFNQYSSLNFLSPFLYVHLDQVCALLCDLNNWYQSKARFTTSLKMESSNIGIEKFDGSDFGFWKMLIEDYLYQKDLHQPLLGLKPHTLTMKQWKLKDLQALGLIRLTLSRNVPFNIIKEKTTSDLLKVLSNMYEKPSAMNKVYLMRRPFTLQISEGGSVADHINEFNMIESELRSVEIIFEDEIKALILMLTLPVS